MSRIELLYYYDDAYDVDEMRNAWIVVRELGIKFSNSWGESMYDGVKFIISDPSTVPENLPPFMTIREM